MTDHVSILAVSARRDGDHVMIATATDAGYRIEFMEPHVAAAAIKHLADALGALATREADIRADITVSSAPHSSDSAPQNDRMVPRRECSLADAPNRPKRSSYLPR